MGKVPNEEFPPRYLLVVMEFDPTVPIEEQVQKPMRTFTFDITKEADYLTGSCIELQMICSAPTWSALEIKINEMYEKQIVEHMENDDED